VIYLQRTVALNWGGRNDENLPKSHRENDGSAGYGYDHYRPQAAGEDLFQENTFHPLDVGRQVKKTISRLSHPDLVVPVEEIVDSERFPIHVRSSIFGPISSDPYPVGEDRGLIPQPFSPELQHAEACLASITTDRPFYG
jgi:hypothetical protein